MYIILSILCFIITYAYTRSIDTSLILFALCVINYRLLDIYKLLLTINKK